jgi:hypothetical protein
MVFRGNTTEGLIAGKLRSREVASDATATPTGVGVCLLAAAISVGACTPRATGLDAAPPSGVCIHTCTPDPGSRPVDCAAAEAGLEFFSDPKAPSIIANFETGVSTTVNGTSLSFIGGQYMYSYVDGTSALIFDGALPGTTGGYQPSAIPASRCKSDPNNTANNHVLHVWGGPFLGWGGGLGVGMAHFNTDSGLCTAFTKPSYCPPNPTSNDDILGGAVSIAALDMSQYDGVAVWARRGPDSQPLMRVLVATKDTEDDVTYIADREAFKRLPNDPVYGNKLPRYCQRIRECSCQYQNLNCSFYDAGTGVVSEGGYYCGAPGEAPGYASMAPVGNNGATNTCNVTRCNDAYAAYPGDGADPKYAGRPCTPFTYRNGTVTSQCWDPAGMAATDGGAGYPPDPPPPEPDKQCGDHFTFPLHLTTDWQLFLVPFTTMYQQGWAQKVPTLDTKTITAVRLTWEAGYIDYYVDDLRFYRVKR